MTGSDEKKEVYREDLIYDFDASGTVSKFKVKVLLRERP